MMHLNIVPIYPIIIFIINILYFTLKTMSCEYNSIKMKSIFVGSDKNNFAVTLSIDAQSSLISGTYFPRYLLCAENFNSFR